MFVEFRVNPGFAFSPSSIRIETRYGRGFALLWIAIDVDERSGDKRCVIPCRAFALFAHATELPKRERGRIDADYSCEGADDVFKLEFRSRSRSPLSMASRSPATACS